MLLLLAMWLQTRQKMPAYLVPRIIINYQWILQLPTAKTWLPEQGSIKNGGRAF